VLVEVRSLRLELESSDLQAKYENMSTSSVKFEHLTEVAQQAVMIVGLGTFFRDKGSRWENYNVVYSPK